MGIFEWPQGGGPIALPAQDFVLHWFSIYGPLQQNRQDKSRI
jgi:hypothetical protein